MRKPVLLFDVMETLVVEPFFDVACELTGLSLPELMDRKNPSLWVEFEKGHISEQEYCDKFFRHGPGVSRDALRERLLAAYQWIDGMERLLAELQAAGFPLHAFSNYPIWYEMIESKLQISRLAPWTFVSYRTGKRKPDREAYEHVVATLGVLPSDCLFIDDRSENTDAACAVGMRGIPFRGVDALRSELKGLGILDV